MSLTPERWQEVLRLYEAASALDAAELDSFLARECSDPELLVEVRKMLAATSAKEFLEPPPLEEPAAGRELGDFTLLEEIGRGGMGVVYRALQRPLKRIVAVKILPASFALTQRQIDRFLREARSTARLSHPNLVTVLTVGDERGVRFFAMEYIAGHNLADELKRLRTDLGADEHDHAHLPSSHASEYFRSIAECMRQAADGLAYAHAHGVIHRDVKPSNLLLDSAGHIKLVDFGLARDEELGSLSASGDVLGTPHYMSPEQARAHRHLIDHRTDVYSLGVVLYELLTLQRPFEGKSSQEVITKLLHADPAGIRKLNPRVPRDLATICHKAMAREPRDRYTDAAAMRDDLQRFLSHEAIVARPLSPAQVAARMAHRHRRLLGGAVLALASLGGGLVIAKERAEQRRTTNLVAIIRSAPDEGPWNMRPLGRLVEVRQAARELRSRPGVLATEEHEELSAAERALETLRVEVTERGRTQLSQSRDPSRSEGEREMNRLAGLLTLRFASDLFPEDPELGVLARAESAYPKIAVQARDWNGDEIGADVLLREIDVQTSGVGEKRLVGRAPLAPLPVPPGYYRVVIVFDDGGFDELVCNPGPASMEVALVATRRNDEASLAEGMIRFEASTYLFADDEDCEWALEGKSVAEGAYFLDAAEVSNAEYLRFVEATGHAEPSYWEFHSDRDLFLADHGDLPVVGVGWNDAVAYAEWAGKRLPTAAEWLRAAGGLENRPLPYPLTTDEGPRGNVSLPFEDIGSERGAWEQYLHCAAPVRSHPDARTPEGAFHMYGNVLEFTESMMVEPAGSSIARPRSLDRLTFGATWYALAVRQGMRAPEYWGIAPHHNSNHLGFRCAKSAEP